MASNKTVKWLLLASLVAAVPVSLQAQSDVPANSARQWLDNMSRSLQSLDYDGTFVYYHDGKLEAMRIVHQASAGGERERLMSLTGSAREVLRDDKVVTCIMPDKKSVMVGQSRPRQPFPDVPEDLDSLSPYYELRDVGEDRVAGLMTRVIDITPRDKYRYGYRFWIDTTNFMLLKFELNAVDGTAIEQVMFTGLRVGDRIPAAALEPSLTGEGYNWFRQGDGGNPAAASGEPEWTVKQLPAGFNLTDYQRRHLHQGREQAEHMVFSDGLATVSVYVEKMLADSPEFTGLSNMGAMNAYGIVIDDHQVTVVGEVPAATVQSIAGLVGRRSP
ncbi:MAG: MucB/RseB C-terminal domain-containing protein [Gammaproteobacteria bacterium]|jgi:sigma-E factor negative regulatory protein RseB